MLNTSETECLSYNGNTLDKELCDATDTNVNLMVPWYLMASYAYYVEDDPILSDSTFDRLAKRIMENWEKIEHHHKDKLTLDMLKAGTYIGEYPSRVQGGLESLRGVYHVGKKYTGKKAV